MQIAPSQGRTAQLAAGQVHTTPHWGTPWSALMYAADITVTFCLEFTNVKIAGNFAARMPYTGI